MKGIRVVDLDVQTLARDAPRTVRRGRAHRAHADGAWTAAQIGVRHQAIGRAWSECLSKPKAAARKSIAAAAS